MSASDNASAHDSEVMQEEEQEYADYEEGETEVQDNGDNVAGQDGERDEADNRSDEDDTEMSRFYMNYLAHREYAVPQKFIIHEAPRNMVVKDPEELGALVILKSRNLWEGLMYYHITLFGGTLVTTGNEESAPYVCFEVKDVDSDDKDWLRPVPKEVIEHFQPKWREAIEAKFAHDRDKKKRILAKYAGVLNWSKDQCSGTKLDPASLGVGNGGMKLLKRKLKTCKVAPQAQSRSQSKTASAKPQSAISKGKKGDASSDASSSSTVTPSLAGKALQIGPVDKVHVFQANGHWFMVQLPGE